MSHKDIDLEGRVAEILNRRAAVGLAVGVVRNGSLESFAAHGLADIATRREITADTAFRIASITKTFTAAAVMQLWEQGLVELDAPANDYLRAFTLLPANPTWREATLRDLLTHTAGVPKLVRPSRALRSGWFGESVALDELIPLLGDFYGGLLRLRAQPGATFNYSDHSAAIVGQIVEDVSGDPLHRYVRDQILAPLGMVDSDLVRSEHVTARLATGYKLGSRGPVPVTDRHWITTAASSLYATPRDMARYVGALLDGGSGERGVILKPETVRMLFEPHWQPDLRIPGMGLTWFREMFGSHLVVEHQGVLPGFNGQVHLAPDDGVGVFAFTNGARNAMTWLPAEVGRLLRDLLGAPADAMPIGVAHHPEIWADLCGTYRPLAQRNDTQVWALAGAGLRVRVRRGRLVLHSLSPVPALYRGFELHPDDPDDPYAFRIDLSRYDLGSAKVVFSRDGDATRVHLGGGIPLSAERRRARNLSGGSR